MTFPRYFELSGLSHKSLKTSCSSDRLVTCGVPTYAVGGLNVVSERLFIQPMLCGTWLYIL